MKTPILMLAALSLGGAAFAQTSMPSAATPPTAPDAAMPATPTSPDATAAPTTAAPTTAAPMSAPTPAAAPPSAMMAATPPAPAADTASYPTCSRTVTDKCVNRGSAPHKARRKG